MCQPTTNTHTHTTKYATMRLFVIDLETYYDKVYSLSKMTTEAYIRDPRFELIGAGIINASTGASLWINESDFVTWVASQDWSTTAILCHHTHFDGGILSWRYGVKPKLWLDTLSMAKAVVGGWLSSKSLANLATAFEAGAKGTEVVAALGKRYVDFTPEEWQKYGEYCINDAELTLRIFNQLMAGFYRSWQRQITAFPKFELKLIDATIRMFTEPMLELDPYLLREDLLVLEEKRASLLRAASVDRSILMSNPKFAGLLQSFGIDPPTKVSPTTGKLTWAFAKTDKGMQALLEHDDERVQAAAAARLGNKSTIAETRVARFLDVQGRGALPVYLHYCGAEQSHRFSGGDKLNCQNLPKKGALRKALCAPPGHLLVVVDSANIEARVLDTIAGEHEAIDVFRKNDRGEGDDVYCYMASKRYGRRITKADPQERQFGKVLVLACFAADTKVLTHTGTKHIVDVSDSDLLWDGETWVTHCGLVYQGIRETVRFHSVSATPDHGVLTELGWRGWLEVHTNHSLMQSAINLGRSLSLGGHRKSEPMDDHRGGTQKRGVLAELRGWWTAITSPAGVAHGATNAQKSRPRQSCIGSTKQLWTTMSIVAGYLTGLTQRSADVTGSTIGLMLHTADAASRYTPSGELTQQRSWRTYRPYHTGTTLNSIWTGQTITKATSLATYASYLTKKIRSIGEKLHRCNLNSMPPMQKLPVFDLSFAGPHNRFTIITDAGPLIVHNCGYGMGGAKFRETARQWGITITEDEAKSAVNDYRAAHRRVVALWRKAEDIFVHMQLGNSVPVDSEGLIRTCQNGLVLPHGLVIKYPELVKDHNGWTYTSGRERGINIYGGKCVENFTQSLARAIVMEQSLAVTARHPEAKLVLSVHDEAVYVVPEAMAEAVRNSAYELFCVSPTWWPDVPLSSEAKIGFRYSEAK